MKQTPELHFSDVAMRRRDERRTAASARTRPSHHYWKTFQTSESKCGSPLRSRACELHLRKALHQIQECDLPLQARELGSNAKMQACAERQVLVVQALQI